MQQSEHSVPYSQCLFLYPSSTTDIAWKNGLRVNVYRPMTRMAHHKKWPVRPTDGPSTNCLLCNRRFVHWTKHGWHILHPLFIRMLVNNLPISIANYSTITFSRLTSLRTSWWYINIILLDRFETRQTENKESTVTRPDQTRPTYDDTKGWLLKIQY